MLARNVCQPMNGGGVNLKKYTLAEVKKEGKTNKRERKKRKNKISEVLMEE